MLPSSTFIDVFIKLMCFTLTNNQSQTLVTVPHEVQSILKKQQTTTEIHLKFQGALMFNTLPDEIQIPREQRCLSKEHYSLSSLKDYYLCTIGICSYGNKSMVLCLIYVTATYRTCMKTHSAYLSKLNFTTTTTTTSRQNF